MSDIEPQSSILSVQDVLEIKRTPIPPTEALTKRIIADSYRLEQNMNSRKPSSVALLLSRFKWTQAVPVAVMASLLAFSLLWLPTSSYLSDPSLLSEPGLMSLAELEFRDSIMLQDELLFAEL